MTEASTILTVLGAAAAGIAATIWRRRPGQLKAKDRYRPLLRETLRDVEHALRKDWKGRSISLVVVPAERKKAGYWQAKVEGDWHHAWTYQGTGLVGVAADPRTMQIAGGRWSGLGHEVAHKVLESHKVPHEQHHGLMKAAGILWEQR